MTGNDFGWRPFNGIYEMFFMDNSCSTHHLFASIQKLDKLETSQQFEKKKKNNDISSYFSESLFAKIWWYVVVVNSMD